MLGQAWQGGVAPAGCELGSLRSRSQAGPNAALLGHQCRRSLPRMQSGPTGVGFLAYKLPLCKIKQVEAFIVSFLLDARYWWLADACVSGCCLLR